MRCNNVCVGFPRMKKAQVGDFCACLTFCAFVFQTMRGSLIRRFHPFVPGPVVVIDAISSYSFVRTSTTIFPSVLPRCCHCMFDACNVNMYHCSSQSCGTHILRQAMVMSDLCVLSVHRLGPATALYFLKI